MVNQLYGQHENGLKKYELWFIHILKFYAGGFHKVVKIKAVARGAKASGWRGVSEWQRFYII